MTRQTIWFLLALALLAPRVQAESLMSCQTEEKQWMTIPIRANVDPIILSRIEKTSTADLQGVLRKLARCQYLDAPNMEYAAIISQSIREELSRRPVKSRAPRIQSLIQFFYWQDVPWFVALSPLLFLPILALIYGLVSPCSNFRRNL